MGTIILADDLTGANDTAIQFVNQGLSALVIPHIQFSDPPAFDSYDVVSFNSNSRGMSAGEARNTVKDMVARLGAANRKLTFYKKIDSVLRGNPGVELAAVMDELGIHLALVAPSFPANRSILEQGMLNSGSGIVDAVKVFAQGMDKKIQNVPLEEIRRGHTSAAEYIRNRHAEGAEVFIADAVTDTDLATVYQIAAALKTPHILAGAAGLANQIARDMGRETAEIPLPFIRQGPVLMIAGTRQGETAAQITTLSRILSAPIIRFRVDLVREGKNEEAILDAYTRAAEELRQKPKVCIIAVESMFRSEIPVGDVDRDKGEGDAEGHAISSALGILAWKLLDAFLFSAMITTGGDTSLAVCKQLDIRGIQPIAEICPGIPMGRIVGGPCEGRYIITKSGRFGTKDTFLEIMNYLSEEEKR